MPRRGFQPGPPRSVADIKALSTNLKGGGTYMYEKSFDALSGGRSQGDHTATLGFGAHAWIKPGTQMSASGHEQTSRHVRVMSVIPLKADIRQRGLHVRLVPEADIARPV